MKAEGSAQGSAFRRITGRAISAGILLFWATGSLLSAQTPAPAPEDEAYRTARVAPFRIIGNIYYVGPSQHITSYLITTPQGHILLDSGYEASVGPIRENIEKLGFQMKDVKIMLGSHAHGYHIAGHALMKELTGAKVLSSELDAEVISTGGKADFRQGNGWKPAKVDQIIRDGEQVKLGDAALVAHLTPGHTKGCTTWTTVVEEGGRRYNVVFLCGMRMNEGIPLIGSAKYPNMAKDFANSFKTLKSLSCDVFLGAHGYWFGLPEKIKRMGQGTGVNPFIDPNGYRAYLDSVEREFLDELKREGGSL
jgi:metallo-beta-lactamase class B